MVNTVGRRTEVLLAVSSLCTLVIFKAYEMYIL